MISPLVLTNGLLPFSVTQLSRALPHVTVGIADLVAVDSVGELAALLEERRLEAMKSGI